MNLGLKVSSFITFDRKVQSGRSWCRFVAETLTYKTTPRLSRLDLCIESYGPKQFVRGIVDNSGTTINPRDKMLEYHQAVSGDGEVGWRQSWHGFRAETLSSSTVPRSSSSDLSIESYGQKQF